MNNQTTINLNGEELVIKQSFRGLMMFEKMTGKSVYTANEDLNDIMTLFYCVIKANNKSFKLSFDEFIDAIDNDPEVFEFYNKFIQDNSPTEEGTGDKKKEVSQ